MSVKKKIKCLVCRLLAKLGLKKTCNAGPLPVVAESPKKTTTKRTTKKQPK